MSKHKPQFYDTEFAKLLREYIDNHPKGETEAAYELAQEIHSAPGTISS